MNAFSEWIKNLTGLEPSIQAKVLASLLAIAILWVLRKVIYIILSRQRLSVQTRYHWRKNIGYGSYVVGLIVIGEIWVEQFQSLATFLGLVSAGIAIALRDPIVNLAGWAFIIWRKPFEVGDRIQIGPHAGDVIDIQPFQFTIVEIQNWVEADQLTGRAILIPNAQIFNTPLANYNHELDYIFHEVPIRITFESNWQKAKQLLTEIVESRTVEITRMAEKGMKQLSQRYLIPDQNMSPRVFTSAREFGVLLTVRFICPSRQRRTMEEVIWEAVLESFREHKDIEFAYPTTRFFDHRAEGKSGTQAP